MKTKTLAVLVGVLAVCAGALLLIMETHGPVAPKDVMGAYLLSSFPVNDVASIMIEDASSSVSLRTREGAWVVKERFDYPASFPMITRFVRQLRDAKVGRTFSSSDEILTRLSLKAPDDDRAAKEAKGVRVTLGDKDGAPLVRLMLGKPRAGDGDGRFPEGRYVMLGDGGTVSVIDTHFPSLVTTPVGWLRKELLDVKPERVRSITCVGVSDGEVRYAFERGGEGEGLRPVHFAEGKKVKDASLRTLAGALSSLRLEDVACAPDDAVAADFPVRVEYRLFDGTVYRVSPGTLSAGAGTPVVKLEAGFEAAPRDTGGEATKSPGESPEKTEPKTPEATESEARDANERLGSWVYVLSTRKHEAFAVSVDSLIDKPKPAVEEKKG